jgi:hypothetical protein
MTDAERMAAIEAIKQVKARYFRGADTGDVALMRDCFTEDCVLDYTDCFVDPASGRDFLDTYSSVIRGKAQWPALSLKDVGIVSVHQGHQAEVEITSDTTADAIFAMTDRLYLPPGAPVTEITGYGMYHESYVKDAGGWKIRTLRLERQRVEGR